MKARGFTLVEVLVTLAIFALLGLGSFSVLDQVLRTKQQSEQRLGAIEQLQYAWLLIENDLRQAAPKPTRPNRNEVVNVYISNSSEQFDSDGGALALVRSGYDNPGLLLPRSELQPVLYRVRENTLERVSSYFVNDTSFEPQVQPLLDQVDGLQVRFFRSPDQADGNTGKSAGWTDEWTSEGSLPAAIEFTLQSQQFGEMSRIFLLAGGSSISSEQEDDRSGGQDE